MKIAVTGDRHWKMNRYGIVLNALRTLPSDAFVVLGDASGVDALAGIACNELGLDFHIEYADWKRFGRAAGPIRNRAMLDHDPDELWYFHDDLANSKGTANCIKQAKKRGITIVAGLQLG